jgi:hypothetical protein
MEMIVYLAIEASRDNGLTCDETVLATGIEKVSVSPRFRPLLMKGLIKIKTNEFGEVKRPGKSGKMQLVWVAA